MEKQECSAQPVDFPDSNMGVQQQVSELRKILVNLRLQLDQCINGGQLESEAEFEDTLGDTSGDAPDCELY
nr:hypothetical protein BaRGS_019533 [Batillaria attramentaria]